MQVKSLTSVEELQRYVDFGQEVYRDKSPWVPPDSHHLVELLSGKGGFGPDTQIQAFLVEKDDQVLATATAVTSDLQACLSKMDRGRALTRAGLDLVSVGEHINTAMSGRRGRRTDW